jgi:hypothetical protein
MPVAASHIKILRIALDDCKLREKLPEACATARVDFGIVLFTMQAAKCTEFAL